MFLGVTVNVLVVIMFIDFVTFSNSTYPVGYLDDLCKCYKSSHKLRCEESVLAPVSTGAGHISLSKHRHFSNHFYCQLAIQAPPGKEVHLNIDYFSLPKTTECSHFFLRVYDGIPSSIKHSSSNGICGNKTKDSLMLSTKNAITLFYYQKKNHHSSIKEFNLTYTFVSQPQGAEHCESTEFMCDNGVCIDNSLKCDNYDNCGDNSDELDLTVCGNFTHSDPLYGVIVGSAVGAVVVVGIILASMCTIRKTFSREPSSNSIEDRTQNEETTHLQTNQNNDGDTSFFQHAWIRNIVSSTQSSEQIEATQNLSPIIEDGPKQNKSIKSDLSIESPSRTRVKQNIPRSLETRTPQTMPKSLLAQDGACCSKYLDEAGTPSLPPSYSQLFPESPDK